MCEKGWSSIYGHFPSLADAAFCSTRFWTEVTNRMPEGKKKGWKRCYMGTSFSLCCRFLSFSLLLSKSLMGGDRWAQPTIRTVSALSSLFSRQIVSRSRTSRCSVVRSSYDDSRWEDNNQYSTLVVASYSMMMSIYESNGSLTRKRYNQRENE